MANIYKINPCFYVLTEIRQIVKLNTKAQNARFLEYFPHMDKNFKFSVMDKKSQSFFQKMGKEGGKEKIAQFKMQYNIDKWTKETDQKNHTVYGCLPCMEIGKIYLFHFFTFMDNFCYGRNMDKRNVICLFTSWMCLNLIIRIEYRIDFLPCFAYSCLPPPPNSSPANSSPPLLIRQPCLSWVLSRIAYLFDKIGPS